MYLHALMDGQQDENRRVLLHVQIYEHHVQLSADHYGLLVSDLYGELDDEYHVLLSDQVHVVLR